MSDSNEPPARGIESRFRDLSVDVRHERLVRYIVRQVGTGRHVDDILTDPYVVAHADELARGRILEHPQVIEAIEEQIKRQFAGYGDSVSGPVPGGKDQPSNEGESDG